jgi:hypothetical protein
MRNRVSYEWSIQYHNDDGDIAAVDFDDKLAGFDVNELAVALDPYNKTRSLALIRHEGNEVEGSAGRAYAYGDHGGLAEYYEEVLMIDVEGKRPPKRYAAELARHSKLIEQAGWIV